MKKERPHQSLLASPSLPATGPVDFHSLHHAPCLVQIQHIVLALHNMFHLSLVPRAGYPNPVHRCSNSGLHDFQYQDSYRNPLAVKKHKKDTEINRLRRLLELSFPLPLPLLIEYISRTAPAHPPFLIFGKDVIVVSQVSISIPLSRNSLRLADDPESPNNVDVLRFPPDPSTPVTRLNIRKERRRSTGGHLCGIGGHLR